MSEFQFDLSNCDKEPIHIPGAIQSHGFLIVIDQQMKIRFQSEGLNNFIPDVNPNLLDQFIQVLEPKLGLEPGFIPQLIKIGKQNNFENINPYAVDLGDQHYYLIISISADYYLLEFEPVAADHEPNLQNMVGSSVSEMLADKNLKVLLDNSARQVKKIINYDRVMVYRFASDGHGEVVAEAKNDNLDPWIGLHYPAADIPNQARELYKLNLTRLIADVDTVPYKITADSAKRPPLDLTYSQLRAVSPIHIQYLKNMGVASSFSISLIYKGELWGLIACHNYTPKFISYKSRTYAQLIGQILSSALEFRQDEENEFINKSFSASLEKITKLLQENELVEDALTQGSTTILNLTHADGVVFNYNQKQTKIGQLPTDEQLRGLIEWAKDTIIDSIYYTDNLSSVYSPAADFINVGSGLLICTLSRELREFMIWFKPEKLHTVKWAGDPQKPVEFDPKGLSVISPRNSFAVWTQEVTGRSESWMPEEINSVIKLRDEIIYAVNQKAGALRLLNERLKDAYAELDTFSYTISHDLKNPLAVIKSYTQLARKDKNISPLTQNFLARVEDKTDRMTDMISEILEYSRIGRIELEFQPVHTGQLIDDLIKDLTFVYKDLDLEFIVGDTPEISGDPTMLSQVFANLISNAVKYSQHAKPAQVRISGESNGTETIYRISDNGMGIAGHDIPKIFELFNRLESAKDIEGSGVGLAIVSRIIAKHNGRITVESEPGEGSTFTISFANIETEPITEVVNDYISE